MVVIIIQKVKPKIKGRITNYLVEVRPGIFVGNLNKKIRELLWNQIVYNIDKGNAILIWSSNTETGYKVKSIGSNRRVFIDFDGAKLINFRPKNRLIN